MSLTMRLAQSLVEVRWIMEKAYLFHPLSAEITTWIYRLKPLACCHKLLHFFGPENIWIERVFQTPDATYLLSSAHAMPFRPRLIYRFSWHTPTASQGASFSNPQGSSWLLTCLAPSTQVPFINSIHLPLAKLKVGHSGAQYFALKIGSSSASANLLFPASYWISQK